jgi:ubiquinone/menaquinone biosynthesis C-methylase UbiE
VQVYDVVVLAELLLSRSRRQRLWRLGRQRLWSLVPAGRILEIGVGTGNNMSYYPANAEVTAVDLSDKMLAQARKRAGSESVDVELHEMDVQDLSFKEDSFDTAVATCVFCSVRDPVRGLRELGRVVRPEGHIVLLDHVRVERPFIGRLMDLLNPIVVRTTGASLNRRTVENVRRAGLIIEREEDLAPMGAVKLIVARPDPETNQGVAEIKEVFRCSTQR